MLDMSKLEPGCADGLNDVDPNNLDPLHFIGVMLASIAISQKRQADMAAGREIAAAYR